ncbi:hypothetical protein [Neorickettsia sp. 179522]|uniref:hypothetical protein n=1 Tax=Neorickettsia sp. 179522 TaxID=1714371 RepID=UPI000797B69B|nr:hypothetical protein [Neorickettsia sp. 179522]KYH12880.1 hypothetical protein AS219_00310 [Neorickettsia sp. 179522]
MRRNSRNDVRSFKISLPDELRTCECIESESSSPEGEAHFHAADSYNQTGSENHSSQRLVWQKLPTEIRKCIFNWQTNLQFVFLGAAWLAIIAAHVAVERIAILKKSSSLNLRISYLLAPSLFLCVLSLMRAVMFDFVFPFNSVCREKVYKLRCRIKEFLRYKKVDVWDPIEVISIIVQPHFSFCNMMLVVGGVLFVVSMTAFIVLECFSVSGLFHNMDPGCLIALQSTLLAISCGSILTVTALLLYRDQVTYAFELDRVDCQKDAVVQYAVH